MSQRMSKIVEENDLLPPDQFGFRKGRSTADAIYILSTLLRKAKGRG